MELFKVKCKVRIVSLEPLLEKVDITPYLHLQIAPNEWVYPIHWVITGGESGNDIGNYRYRPCRIEWLHEVVKACKAKDVPVFVKQLGTSASKQLALKQRHGDDITEQGFPMYLKYQEFPSIVDI
jgi:protein gp37